MNQSVDLAPALCGLVLFFQSSGTTAAEFISGAARRRVDGHDDGACASSWLRRFDSLIFTLPLLCGLTFDMSGPEPAWPANAERYSELHRGPSRWRSTRATR
jgi:hypothetical protein